MDTSTLVKDGLSLMVMGMGFVFVFLTLLVIATSLMSWIITRIERNVGTIPKEGVPAPATYIPHPDTHQESGHTDDPTLISVISAAIFKYRSHQKK